MKVKLSGSAHFQRTIRTKSAGGFSIGTPAQRSSYPEKGAGVSAFELPSISVFCRRSFIDPQQSRKLITKEIERLSIKSRND
jgi:hypothetical protein